MRILFALFVLSLTAAAFPQEPPPVADAGGEFDLRKFVDERLAAGEKQVVIPPGRYRVSPLKREHLAFRGLTDVEVVAEGVELVCTQTTRAVTVQDCRNFTLRGLTIDYDPLPFTQGRVVALSGDGKTLDVELFEGYPAAATAVNHKAEIYDPGTRTVRFRQEALRAVEAVGPMTLRLTKTVANPTQVERPGDLLVINSLQAPGGLLPHAVYAEGCVGVRFEGITVFAADNFGFAEAHCDGTAYTRCILDRRPPGDDPAGRRMPRLRSVNADGIHSLSAPTGPQISGCVARFMGDDPVNIHGDYQLVLEGRAGVLRVTAKRANEMIQAGEPVELLRDDGTRLPDAVAVSVGPAPPATEPERQFLAAQRFLGAMDRAAPPAVFLVTLDRPVDLPTGSLIGPLNRRGDGFTIADCTFGPVYAHGMQIKASRGRVTGNRFLDTWREAILVMPSYRWLESGGVTDLLIEDNTITDCRSIALTVSAEGQAGTPSPAGVHRNITVRGNKFRNCPVPNALFTSVDGLTFDGNTLALSRAAGSVPRDVLRLGLDPKQLAPVMSDRCEGVTANRNRITTGR